MAENDPQLDDLASLTFEDALSALDEIVAKLEAGDVSLEASIEMYTRGTLLKQHCEDKLKSAQAKIEKITLNEAGDVKSTAPLDTE